MVDIKLTLSIESTLTSKKDHHKKQENTKEFLGLPVGSQYMALELITLVLIKLPEYHCQSH